MPQISPGLQRATTELTGQVFVVADPDTNSLLVTTASKYQEQVRDDHRRSSTAPCRRC